MVVENVRWCIGFGAGSGNWKPSEQGNFGAFGALCALCVWIIGRTTRTCATRGIGMFGVAHSGVQGLHELKLV